MLRSIRLSSCVLVGMLMSLSVWSIRPAEAAEGPVLQPGVVSRIPDYTPWNSKSGDITLLGLNTKTGKYFPLVSSINTNIGSDNVIQYTGPKLSYPQFPECFVDSVQTFINVVPGAGQDAIIKVELNGNYGAVHITGTWNYGQFGSPMRASMYIGALNYTNPIWKSNGTPGQTNPIDVTIPYHAGDELFLDMGLQGNQLKQYTIGGWYDLQITPTTQSGTPTDTSTPSQGTLTEDEVKQDFMNALGRVPTSSELSALYSQTDWTNDTLLQHFRDMIQSNKSLQQTLINNSYWTVFWRGPLPSEVTYWEKQLQQTGMDFQELVANHINFLRTNTDMRTAAIHNAHLIYVGREATSSELQYWTQQIQSGKVKTYQDLVNQMEQPIRTNASLQEDIIRRSYLDAFGRTETKAEFQYWQGQLAKGNVNYTELIHLHRQYIEKDSTSRATVIRMSYEQVFKRLPTKAEFQYWDGYVQKVGLTYSDLVRAHQNWLAANQQTLQADSKLNQALQTQGLRINPSNGDIVNIKTGQVKYPSGDYVIGTLDGKGHLIASGSGNVIAVGGANVIAAGGANVIAAGGANVIAAGGANVIAAGGANVIAAGGANVIASGGANVIAAGGANVIAAGGANVIAAGGANVIASGGANMVGGGAELNPGELELQNGSNVIAAGGANVIAAGGAN